VAQFHAFQPFETPSQPTHPNMKLVLSKDQLVFKIPQGHPPSHSAHDHFISLIPGSLPHNVCSYCHPFAQKKEIENMVHELLVVGVIHPSTNPYPSPIVMVLKKEGT
jgi:hypothetical protein